MAPQVGLEPACKRQSKDLTGTAGEFKSSQVHDKRESDFWNHFSFGGGVAVKHRQDRRQSQSSPERQ
jgi:hypothetical protein